MLFFQGDRSSQTEDTAPKQLRTCGLSAQGISLPAVSLDQAKREPITQLSLGSVKATYPHSLPSLCLVLFWLFVWKKKKKERKKK
jgi:hypothetical protein